MKMCGISECDGKSSHVASDRSVVIMVVILLSRYHMLKTVMMRVCSSRQSKM